MHLLSSSVPFFLWWGTRRRPLIRSKLIHFRSLKHGSRHLCRGNISDTQRDVLGHEVVGVPVQVSRPYSLPIHHHFVRRVECLHVGLIGRSPAARTVMRAVGIVAVLADGHCGKAIHVLLCGIPRLCNLLLESPFGDDDGGSVLVCHGDVLRPPRLPLGKHRVGLPPRGQWGACFLKGSRHLLAENADGVSQASSREHDSRR
mmetsp:Transcript_4367/g.12382  ORF Transcript_4367/g.12382 Transcript_4367/m.12382 type:complete len:202 (+) Transcript_4367:1715-2320(+)